MTQASGRPAAPAGRKRRHSRHAWCSPPAIAAVLLTLSACSAGPRSAPAPTPAPAPPEARPRLPPPPPSRPPVRPRERDSATRDPRYLWLLRQPPPHRLRLPVDGVAPADLRDSWGAPRGGGRRHEGIDIFAPRDTPVRSATAGFVHFRGRNRLGGNVVKVLGPAGWIHYYAHLERWAPIREGQWVDAGDLLGYVGTSGNARATAPHLHYGIYSRGRALNPYPLLLSPHGEQR